MSARERWATIVLAVTGSGTCLAALTAFLFDIVNNKLPWTTSLSARDHYLAVGRSYSQGFAVGFFLCFFLSLMIVALIPWLQRRRRVAATLDQTQS